MTEHIPSKDEVPAWEAAPLLQRLRECRFMLYQHGILTDAQSDRAEEKINKKAMIHDGK